MYAITNWQTLPGLYSKADERDGYEAKSGREMKTKTNRKEITNA